MKQFLFLLCILGVTPRLAIADEAGNHAKLSELVEEQWQYLLRTDPEVAAEGGDYRYNDKLDDRSAEAHIQEIGHARQMLKRFEAVGTDGLSPEEKVTRTLLIANLRRTI